MLNLFFHASEYFFQKTILSSLFICFIIPFCMGQNTNIELQSGDLLFVGSKKTGISSAINKVTQTESNTHFSHVAIIEKKGTKIWVLHATSPEGSVRMPLGTFLKNEDSDARNIIVYRIKKEVHPRFELAIKRAKAMLGKPYNYTYILSDTAYYCSDFVYKAFLMDHIFTLNPMTFKNPESHTFNKKWVRYYQKLGIPIPEGKPGCNPNGMAHSFKLKRIGKLHWKFSSVIKTN